MVDTAPGRLPRPFCEIAAALLNEAAELRGRVHGEGDQVDASVLRARLSKVVVRGQRTQRRETDHRLHKVVEEEVACAHYRSVRAVDDRAQARPAEDQLPLKLSALA